VSPAITQPRFPYSPSKAKKPVIANCLPKLVAIATSLSTSGLLSNTISWTHPAHNPNGILISLAIFAEMTAKCPYTSQWDVPCPLKTAPSMGGSGPLTYFSGPTRVLNPNGISITSAVFAGLTSVTDRQTADQQTDRQTTLLDR